MYALFVVVAVCVCVVFSQFIIDGGWFRLFDYSLIVERV